MNDNQNGKVRVLVADDHEMILEMIELFLSQTGDFEVWTARSLKDAIEQIKKNGPFDIVLLDFVMPGMKGVAGLKTAIQSNGGKPVGIITGSPSGRNVTDIVNAGAAGIVLKTTPMRTLANALRFMAAGELYLPRQITIDREQEVDDANALLSKKESQVLSHLVEGMSNREIGEALQLAEPTIKMHVRSICGKLEAKNRTQAVLRAKELGLY
ncbi:response regulator transcription factor [Roseovarius sp.]|uniref:response regulator transcription factor n=1 Tax=Roseovarius sp. TaxID=1486281 RepID=UPI003BADB454